MKIRHKISKWFFWTFLIINKRLLFTLQYFHQRGHFPNFKNPKDLSEHVLSDLLKPYSFSKYSQYADKIKVREYVKEKGLEELLLKHFGVWDDANKIDFLMLPDKFVLKTNNGSGGHTFCRNKSTLNRTETVKKINTKLRLSTAFNREPHYKEIIPLIFCEELIDTGNNSLPTDYKFMCFNGEPYEIQVCTERGKSTKFCTFDMNWNVLSNIKEKFLPKTLPEKPENLDEMIKIARTLSKDFKFVRVDLYNTGEKIFFGELTFTPSCGLFHSHTNESLIKMGELYKK